LKLCGVMAARHDSFYGRRKGKPLRPEQAERLTRLLPVLRIDTALPPPDHLAALFSVPVSAIVLEIGFGGGERLIHEAELAPQTGFIGVEVFEAGLAKAVRGIEKSSLANIRLYDRDAGPLLDWLPAGSITRIDLFYPDPWPKRRHWKRRFVSAANLKRIARVLEPGGTFRFASDIAAYVDWTLHHTWREPALTWTAETADDWRRPWPDWPGTRYETKAIGEGRRPAYLTFRKTG
jgi:tRNA (guanine-N7-)-methyltransferase